MKTFFLLLLISLSLAASTTTVFAQCNNDVQGEGTTTKDPLIPPHTGYEQCPDETIKKLDVCQDYMTDRCIPGRDWRWRKSCEKVQSMCCQQLAETPQQCRCKTICKGFQNELGFLLEHADLYVRSYWQGYVASLTKKAQSLPSVCNMTPSSCNLPTTATGGCF
ncbi:puroindoline-B-like [Lolium rigidum]|uniref:puroindoline-B-like n=1 Tax=Lolium rigidum TaxID=89674 RepID=UPI001F5C0F4A|nr:puroindoline-B-like [Lolium rigidum]